MKSYVQLLESYQTAAPPPPTLFSRLSCPFTSCCFLPSAQGVGKFSRVGNMKVSLGLHPGRTGLHGGEWYPYEHAAQLGGDGDKSCRSVGRGLPGIAAGTGSILMVSLVWPVRCSPC